MKGHRPKLWIFILATILHLFAVSFTASSAPHEPRCDDLHSNTECTRTARDPRERGSRMLRYSKSASRPPDDEVRILLAFRKAITNDPNGLLNGWSWSNRSNVCLWNGVTCDPAFQHVAYLFLVQQSLEGTISPELGGLAFILSLELMDNHFHGPIPPSLGNCSELYGLGLGGNHLSRGIPAELGLLANLSYIDIPDNQLTGPIPPQLGNCSALTSLVFPRNQINGTIPPSLGTLSHLRWLDFSFNNLSGEIPKSLGNHDTVDSLNLSYNQLSGEIPAEVLRLPYLSGLWLSFNKLTGSLAHGAMMNLSFNIVNFLVDGNQLSGTVPVSSFNICTKMTILDMSWNSFSGALPSVPATISLAMNLSNNQFSGEIPLSYVESQQIFTLDISHNRITGPITSTFCAHPQEQAILGILRLDHNLFTGEFPAGLPNCQWLADLRLNNNFFSGMIPADLGQLGTARLARGLPALIRSIDLSYNSFSGEIPASLGLVNLQQLEFLRLNNNLLNGKLLVDFRNLSSLISLTLAHNMLTGEIPESMENCTALQVLDLSSNQFSGQIPDLSYGFPSLRVLNLGSNGLTGGVPNWILNLTRLQILDLSNNLLDGNMPRNLTNLLGMRKDHSNSSSPTDNSTLQEVVGTIINGNTVTLSYVLLTETILNFSNNSFHGGMPPEIGDLKSLKFINISSNRLNGTIDEGLGLIHALESLDLSRNELSGRIPSFLSHMDLGYLNLTYSNLSGDVPTTNFPSSSYVPGNDNLCSLIVLNRNCTSKSSTSEPSSASSGTKFDSEVSILAFEAGSLLGFLSVGTILVLSQDVRAVFFKLVHLPIRDREVEESPFNLRHISY